LTAATAFF
jgi:hypothetical protein